MSAGRHLAPRSVTSDRKNVAPLEPWRGRGGPADSTIAQINKRRLGMSSDGGDSRPDRREGLAPRRFSCDPTVRLHGSRRETPSRLRLTDRPFLLVGQEPRTENREL